MVNNLLRLVGLNVISGYRTYIIAAVMLVLGGLQGLDLIAVPEFVWVILGAVGLGTLRAGVEKIESAIKEHNSSN